VAGCRIQTDFKLQLQETCGLRVIPRCKILALHTASVQAARRTLRAAAYCIRWKLWSCRGGDACSSGGGSGDSGRAIRLICPLRAAHRARVVLFEPLHDAVDVEGVLAASPDRRAVIAGHLAVRAARLERLQGNGTDQSDPPPTPPLTRSPSQSKSRSATPLPNTQRGLPLAC